MLRQKRPIHKCNRIIHTNHLIQTILLHSLEDIEFSYSIPCTKRTFCSNQCICCLSSLWSS
uniref:Uncharacterized protein n=1 Tax=Anguilla anguilla TaxID=7936 RepID=A0A0E9RAG2_ANGAN